MPAVSAIKRLKTNSACFPSTMMSWEKVIRPMSMRASPCRWPVLFIRSRDSWGCSLVICPALKSSTPRTSASDKGSVRKATGPPLFQNP